MIAVKDAFAIATLAVVMLAPSGCPPQGSSSGGGAGPADPTPKACDTQPKAPHVITFAGKKSVEGETTSTCEVSPVQHNVQVFLERKAGNRWVGQPDPYGKPAGNCLDIPGAGDPKTCQWIITRCDPGLWRTRVRVYGYGPAVKDFPGGKPFNFDVPEKPEAQLTC